MGQVNIDQQASGYIPFGADSEIQLRHLKDIRIGEPHEVSDVPLKAPQTIDNEIGNADIASTLSARVRGWIVSIAILGIALGLIFVLSSNWTTWASNGDEQKTDDAYLRADVTPLSTKAAGLVASVEVSDYQHVKTGDVLAVDGGAVDFMSKPFDVPDLLRAILRAAHESSNE